MEFKMSPNIAVRTDRFSDAVRFYTEVIGFENRSQDPELADLDASPLNIFIIKDVALMAITLSALFIILKPWVFKEALLLRRPSKSYSLVGVYRLLYIQPLPLLFAGQVLQVELLPQE